MAEASLRGRRGDGVAKLRPVIVIDDRIEHGIDSEVEVVVVTHTPDEPDGVYIDVPFAANGNCCSKLGKASWACAHWVTRVHIGELDINKYGYCGPGALKRILAEVGKRR